MNRRGFLAKIAALAGAPLAGAFNQHRSPLLGAWNGEARWAGYARCYTTIDKDDLIRKLRHAQSEMVFQPPIAVLPPSSRSEIVESVRAAVAEMRDGFTGVDAFRDKLLAAIRARK